MKQWDSLEQLREILSKEIPGRRYRHTLGVEKEAVRYAKKLGGDAYKAAVAGLLHDVTKCMPNEQQLDYLDAYGVVLTQLERVNPKLYHAISGAAVARYEYGVEDPEILDAIRYHTTLREGMTLLDQIIYMADFTEETRDYDDVDKLRKLADKDFIGGMIYALDYSICEVVDNGGLLHPQTVAARNQLVMQRILEKV